MPLAAFATLVLATLSGCPSPSQAPHPRPTASPAPLRQRGAQPSFDLPVGDVYSARAKRRIASYLRMRLLELRKERLSRALEALEGRLGIDELIRSL
jgi:hypothetical protein